MAIRVLSVAEKPSVAKELANIIGNGRYNQYNSPSPYNKIFEIANCPFRQGNASMRITSVTGHLMEAEFDPRYRSWSACQPGELFHAPINKQVKNENINVKRNLMDEARNCSVLLLWLDCDLEGENIAYEVIQVCTEVNPRLDIFRARFSALIPRDIMRALKFPDRPNPLFNAAVEARIEIDLRLGAAFTRFQTQRLQNKWEGVTSMVSYGPCQFPTLGFVVERHLQIQKFRPEEYWSLKCTYECDEPTEKSGKLHCSFNWSRGLVYDKFTTLVLFDLCTEGGGSAKVISCDTRPTSHARPCPMNTIELQKRASRLLRLSSERTMVRALKYFIVSLIATLTLTILAYLLIIE